MRRILLCLLACLLAIPSICGASIKLSVSPQRGKNIIEVGDIFYLYITLTDINETPAKPSLNGAKLIYFDRTSQQSSFSSVNGVTSQSFTYTYTATLRAEKEGTFKYGPVALGNQKSNQVTYTIGKASASTGVPSSPSDTPQDTSDDDKPKYIGKGDANLFLRATVSESTVYEQQALVYTVKLYTTYDAIKFIGATSAPKFDGFVIEESPDISTSLSLETYQGKSYATAIIARYIIFPQMTGNLKITGNTYTISVDRREYFHDAFWGNMSFSTPLQLNVTPNDLVVNVKPLPQPKPADFSGGVGQFSISGELKNSEFKTNQAASIVYTIKGTGNLKYIQLPDLATIYPPEIEVYTPKTSQDVSVGSNSVTGSVSYDYSFMPLEEGSYRLPDVKLVYFNPVSGQYETSVARGFDINVGKGSVTKKSNRNNLHFISDLESVDINTLRHYRTPFVKSFVYWLWFLIPAVLLLLSYVIFRSYVSKHADMVSLNSKRADKMARKRMKKAFKALKANDYELFYDELLNSLWGYLGDKLKMPTSELMRDNVRQIMLQHSISEDLVNNFIHLIDEAEFAKYSSEKSHENMEKNYEDSIGMINKFEKEYKKSKI